MSFPYPYTGPIAPENNPPIEPQFYAPSRFVIIGLNLSIFTTVSTQTSHNYVIGQQVRLHVPVFYGTFEINGQEGIVVSIPASNQVMLNINSVGYTPFIPSPAYGPTLPQIIPIGDINSGAINSQGRQNNILTVPGAFINVSPQ